MGDDDEEIGSAEAETPPDLIGQRFAANLRTFRESGGISQGRLAAEMLARGWSWRQQTVARVESGQRTVALAEAAAIAEIMNISLVQLTASTRESALLRRLAGAVERAGEAHGVIADQTELLLHAQRQLRMSIKEAEQEGYCDSPAVKAAADEGAEALSWTPEQAVRKGRRDFHHSLPPGTDDAAPPITEAFSPEAIRSAVAIQSHAAVATVTPEILAKITAEVTPGEVDAVIAAIAEVARQEKNGTVLRHIRQAGLERLAAEGLAAGWTLGASGMPHEDFDQFISTVFTAVGGDQSARESARKDALDYIDGGGTSMLAIASLIVAKMPTENLAAFVSLRGRSISGAMGSRDAGLRETKPQPVIE